MVDKDVVSAPISTSVFLPWFANRANLQTPDNPFETFLLTVKTGLNPLA